MYLAKSVSDRLIYLIRKGTTGPGWVKTGTRRSASGPDEKTVVTVLMDSRVEKKHAVPI